MKKRSLTLIAVLMVVLLLTLSVPAYAGQPETAGGDWFYSSTVLDEKQAGCNTFLTTFETAQWTGTFQGNSTESGQVVRYYDGHRSYNAIVTFDDEILYGKQGGLVLSVVGKRPYAGADWDGKWVILSGTGDLANLHGQGDWFGPGGGHVEYAGQYHFEGQ
jgi:hypothetical protein